MQPLVGTAAGRRLRILATQLALPSPAVAAAPGPLLQHTPILGFVSDERYVALSDVGILIESEEHGSVQIQTRVDGSIAAALPSGDFKFTLWKDRFSGKRVDVTLPSAGPLQLRLLSNKLVGYMHPKWAQAGEKSEFRVHSSEEYNLKMFRYGLQKEFIQTIGVYDEHGPGATQQCTPDGDYTKTGVQFNRQGFSNNPHHNQNVVAPKRSGLYYMHAEGVSGEFYSFPFIVAPAAAAPKAPIAVLLANMNWNAYNNWGGRSSYIHPVELPPKPSVNARFDLDRYTKMDNFMHFNSEHVRLMQPAMMPVYTCAPHGPLALYLLRHC